MNSGPKQKKTVDSIYKGKGGGGGCETTCDHENHPNLNQISHHPTVFFLSFLSFSPPRYLPKWIGGGGAEADCGVKSRDDLDGPGGFWHPKSRTWLFRANATGPRPAPVQLTMSIFSNQHNEKKEKEDVYLYSTTGTFIPVPTSINQPTRHPLSLLSSYPPPSSCPSL